MFYVICEAQRRSQKKKIKTIIFIRNFQLNHIHELINCCYLRIKKIESNDLWHSMNKIEFCALTCMMQFV